MQFIRLFNPFKKPTAAMLIQQAIEDYERSLLEKEASAAYNTKMAEFYLEGILRLRAQQQESLERALSLGS